MPAKQNMDWRWIPGSGLLHANGGYATLQVSILRMLEKKHMQTNTKSNGRHVPATEHAGQGAGVASD